MIGRGLIIPTRNTLRNNLLLRWGFEEGSSNTLHDTSGHGFNGTLYGSPAWELSGSRPGVTFNGSSQYASSALGTLLSGLQTVTCCLLASGLTNTGTRIIVEYGTDWGANAGTFGAYTDSGTIETGVRGNVGHNYRSNSTSFDTGLHLFCFVFDYTQGDGVSETSMYIDGVVSGYSSQSTTGNNTGTFDTNKSLYLAARAGTSLWLSLSIYEFRVYSGLLPIDAMKAIRWGKG